MVEARVVRVYETALLKTLRLTTKFEIVGEDFLRPALVVAKVCNHLVVLIEKRDPGVKIRAQQNVTLNINVRGKCQAVYDASQFSIKREILQSSVRSIADGDFGFSVAAVVQP